MTNALIILALTIIGLLGAYALYLQIKLKQHKTKLAQEEQEAQAKLLEFQQNLIEDIRFIAKAMIQKQCDLTEGVLRVHNLINRLDENIWNNPQLKQTQLYYAQCSDMPILEAYKQQTKQQKMQQDLKRVKLEQQYEQSILNEMSWLNTYSFDELNN